MALTIDDIYDKEFALKGGGYDRNDVDQFLDEICDEMNIDACVVTVTEQDGTERSYNEVVLDGELYLLNATEDGGILEKYTPEEIN